jgi:acyl carrier protein
MSPREQVLKMVYDVLDELNEARAARDRIPKEPDTPLVGGRLDSLGVVTLVTGVDERFQEAHGVDIGVLDLVAAPPQNSSLRSVGTFVDYLIRKLPGALQ